VSEIRIDGTIGRGEGEVSAAMVRDQLAVADRSQTLVVRIHSEGGSVFEGFAIYDALKAYEGPKRCVVESSAFSIASFVTMAFNDIEITPNGYLMLHCPYVQAIGDAEELTKQVQLLTGMTAQMVDAYAERSGKTTQEIEAILKRETYLSATEAVQGGFATRVSGTSVIGRVFAKINTMPHGVVSALFGADLCGDENEPTKDLTMSDSKAVVATLQEIRAAYPKAKSDFVLNCLEKSMPMASVAQAAVEEMMAENAALSQQVAAMEQELAKYKMMEVEVSPSEPMEEEMAMEEEEEEVMAVVAKRRGVAPVRVAAKTPVASATDRWRAAVNSCKLIHDNNAKAVKAAVKANPGLREQYVAEVNAR